MARYEVLEDTGGVERTVPPWSPAQVVVLIIGIGITVLGVAALARTGFDTRHIYTPQDVVWRLPHSPLFALIEIGYGLLLMVAGVVPGGMRTLMTALGAAALAFGVVVLTEAAPNRLNHWLGVTHRSGWFFVIVGAVVVAASLLSPVFAGRTRRVVTEQRIVG